MRLQRTDEMVLDVMLSGVVRATVEGQPVRLSSPHIKSMLAVAALGEGHRVSRARLRGLLWLDGPIAHASLRQIIKKLKDRLDAAGYRAHRFDATSIALGSGTVRVDLHEVIAHAERHLVHPLLVEVAEYTTTLLDGIEDLNDEVTAWARDVRTDAHNRLSAALADGMENAELPRPRRLELAEALLRLDPCHEPACRQVMRLRAEAGDGAGAQRAYLDLWAALEARLDDHPGDETAELYGQIKSQSEALGAPPTRQEPEMVWPVPLAETGAPLIAVLPFDTQVGCDIKAWFGAGLAEEIIGTLAGFDEIGVISHSSTRSYAGKAVDVRDVGRAMGVRYVVQGTLVRAGAAFRLRAELTDPNTRKVLWWRTFSFDDDSLFGVLDELAARIVGEVAPNIRAAELVRIRLKRPESRTAYDHTLQGLDLLYRLAPEHFGRARGYFDQAMVMDPDYAPPYALAAEWHSLRVGQAWSDDPQADREAAVRMAEAALDRDRSNVRALTELGHDRAFLHRDYDGALSLFARAEVVGPGSAQVWAQSAPTYCYVGEGGEAVRRMRRAMLLSPQDLFAFRLQAIMAMAHYTAGTFEESIHWGRRAQAENGRYTAIPRLLAAAAAAAGDVAGAQEHAARLLALEPGFTVAGYHGRCPFRDPARVTAMCEHLLAAGLPA